MADDAIVRYTEHARLRMRDHDILDEEVELALSAPPARHKRRKDGRAEARQRINTRMLLVIYKINAREILVISAMWE
jgi:hypothetical protein